MFWELLANYFPFSSLVLFSDCLGFLSELSLPFDLILPCAYTSGTGCGSLPNIYSFSLVGCLIESSELVTKLLLPKF